MGDESDAREPPERRWQSGWLVVAMVTAMAGCAGQQAFRPAERASARTLSGYLAAEYELERPGGQDIGEVKVWSAGAREDEEYDAASLHVGFELENEGSTPMVLDGKSIYLDSATFDGGVLKNVRPTRVEGDTTLGPEQTGEVHVYFLLHQDGGIDPTDIEGFRIRWVVTSEDYRFSEYTSFVGVRPAAARAGYDFYYAPYYDPFLYPGFYYRPYVLYPRPYYLRRRIIRAQPMRKR